MLGGFSRLAVLPRQGVQRGAVALLQPIAPLLRDFLLSAGRKAALSQMSCTTLGKGFQGQCVFLVVP